MEHKRRADFSADSDDAPVAKWVRIGDSHRFKRAATPLSPPPTPTHSSNAPETPKTPEAPMKTAKLEVPPAPTKPRGFTQLKPHPSFMGPQRRIVPRAIIFR